MSRIIMAISPSTWGWMLYKRGDVCTNIGGWFYCAFILHNVKIAISGVMVLLNTTVCPINFLSLVLSQDPRYPIMNRLVLFLCGLLSRPHAHSLVPDLSTLSYTFKMFWERKNIFLAVIVLWRIVSCACGIFPPEVF